MGIVLATVVALFAGGWGYVAGYNKGLKDGLRFTSVILAKAVSAALEMLGVPHQKPPGYEHEDDNGPL